MKLSSKLFLLSADDTLHALASAAFMRMLRQEDLARVPDFAGQRVRQASVVVQVVDGMPLRMVAACLGIHLHLDRRNVDGLEARLGQASGHRSSQVAGAAADVEHPARVARPDEVELGLGQAVAPAAHRQLVAVAIGGDEGRRCVYRPAPFRSRGAPLAPR